MARARRKMSAKQVKFFGTKRQKAALRAKRSAPKHRARTRPNPPRKRRRVVAKRAAPRRVAVKTSARKRRKNPTPMIISWAAGNPAKRSTKVAKSRVRRKKRYATAKRSNAGRRRSVRVVRHHKRRNPSAIGNPMDWVQGGAGVLAGVVGTRAIPQLVLGASNTGAMGYVANAVAAAGLGFLSHLLFPRNLKITGAVVAGGFAALIARVISDQTPFGAQLSLTGLGDYGLGLYQKSNYPYPPHLVNGRGPNSSMFTWGDGSQGSVGGVPATLAAPADSTGAC